MTPLIAFLNSAGLALLILCALMIVAVGVLVMVSALIETLWPTPPSFDLWDGGDQ